MRKDVKKIVALGTLAAVLATTGVSGTTVDTKAAKKQESTITYNNKVFTEKFAKKVKTVSFNNKKTTDDKCIQKLCELFAELSMQETTELTGRYANDLAKPEELVAGIPEPIVFTLSDKMSYTVESTDSQMKVQIKKGSKEISTKYYNLASFVSNIFWKNVSATIKADNVYSCIKIEQYKKYKLKDFVRKIKGISWEAEKFYYEAFQAKKVKLSGKGITVKNTTFQVKKTGTYTVKIKAKGKSYKIPVTVIPKILKDNEKKTASVTIIQPVTGLENQTGPAYKTAHITDKKVLETLQKKMNAAKYQFDFAGAQQHGVGDMSIVVNYFDEKADTIRILKISESGIRDVSTDGYWTNFSEAKALYNYLELFFEASGTIVKN